MSSSAGSVRLKRSACGSPDSLVQNPVDRYARFAEEGIKKCLTSTRESQELSEDRGGNDEISLPQCCIESALGQRVESDVLVPQRNDNVGVNRGGHRPRSARIRRIMAFLPDRIPAFPIPRYLAKGLLDLTGRTRMTLPAFSKSNVSPGRTPKARRISWGTVTCPLLVIRACFFTATLLAPYFNTWVLTLGRLPGAPNHPSK
jgi:hypothetical protein